MSDKKDSALDDDLFWYEIWFKYSVVLYKPAFLFSIKSFFFKQAESSIFGEHSHLALLFDWTFKTSATSIIFLNKLNSHFRVDEIEHLQ